MRKLAIAFLLVAAVGCGGAPTSQNAMLIDPGPAPANGMQIILPVIHDVKPGSDNELCTWTGTIADHDMYIKGVQGFQSPGGHHLIIYRTSKHQPAGTTRVCTDQDMTTVRYLVGANGEGDIAMAPGDLSYTIKAGDQIVINHHYINATPKAEDVQSAINLFFADPGTKVIPSGALAVVDTALHLPPGQPTVDVDCTMQKAQKVWFSIPHMHAYGNVITVDHTHAGQTERLFDTPWIPEYTFHPPTVTEDPNAPKLFDVGDNIHLHCEWNNTTGGDLTFGVEMCVFFAQTVDDTGTGSIACDQGNWTNF